MGWNGSYPQNFNNARTDRWAGKITDHGAGDQLRETDAGKEIWY